MNHNVEFIGDFFQIKINNNFSATNLSKSEELVTNNVIKNKLNENRVLIDWNLILDLHKKIENIKNISFNNYTDYLILSLYCLLPPDNFANIRIIKKINEATDLKLNYYACDNKTFVFNKYKTSKIKNKDDSIRYARIQKVEIDDTLANIINEYINHKDRKKDNLLLPNARFIDRRLLKMLKTINDKCTNTIDTIKYSIETYLNNINVGQKEQTIKIISHTVLMQLYYAKNKLK